MPDDGGMLRFGVSNEGAGGGVSNRELREDGGNELREDGGVELRE
jgi:hypothetical protein